ncbi:MAG: response regulator [Anaerolineales bacterium]
MNQAMKILVVDDDRRMTRTLADILNLAGYEVVEAWSGVQALEKVRQQQFDCVLTDIKMAEMNGVELHRQLRLLQPGLPVLLMTAYAAEELIHQGLAEGAVGVLEKPLAIYQLLAFFGLMAKNRMVVVVDDDPQFCQTLKDILGQRGFSVAQFSDPHAAIEEITAEAQIILLDLHLNRRTGLDVFREIRQKFPVLPVLFVTGLRDEAAPLLQEALAVDAYALLYKPLEIPQLLQTLAELQLKNLRALLKST